jgi:putative transcriptional regulator
MHIGRSGEQEIGDMTRLGKELIESAAEALAIAQGKAAPARTIAVETVDVAAIRKRLGLSQDAFARKFGLSAATLRDWEQGRRQMDRTAQAFLKVIDRAPEAVEKALTSA